MDPEALQRRINHLELELLLCRAQYRAQKLSFECFCQTVLDRLELASMPAPSSGTATPSSRLKDDTNPSTASTSRTSLSPTDWSEKYPALCPAPHSRSTLPSPRDLQKNHDPKKRQQQEGNDSLGDQPGIKYYFRKKTAAHMPSITDFETTASSPDDGLSSSSGELQDSDDPDYNPATSCFPSKRHVAKNAAAVSSGMQRIARAASCASSNQGYTRDASTRYSLVFKDQPGKKFDAKSPTAAAARKEGSSRSPSSVRSFHIPRQSDSLAVECDAWKPLQVSAGSNSSNSLGESAATASHPKSSAARDLGLSDMDRISARLETTRLRTASPISGAKTHRGDRGSDTMKINTERDLALPPIITTKTCDPSPLSRTDFIKDGLARATRKAGTTVTKQDGKSTSVAEADSATQETVKASGPKHPSVQSRHFRNYADLDGQATKCLPPYSTWPLRELEY